MTPRTSTKLLFQSRTSEFAATIECLVLPQITSNQPSCFLDRSQFIIPNNIKLADPKFCESSTIDLLIGAAHFFELMSIGQIRMANHLPLLQNTRLGWVVAGQMLGSKQNDSCLSLHIYTTEVLEDQVQRFWKLDSVPDGSTATHFNHPCDKHFASTHGRNEKGQFVVRLPFTETSDNLGNSSNMARRRFTQLEKRLSRDLLLSASYKSFLDEYLNLQHMELVPTNLIQSSNFYLPHHCVLKPDSSSTKLRVVFDASAKSTSNKSLNDILLVGPVIQNDLFFVLCRFRSHAFAFSADVSKMYRQILVHEDDRKFQYIFWRDDPSKLLNTYQLNTVTYGTSAAPFLATRCLLQLALESESVNAKASAVIRNDIYVDDLLSGGHSIEEAARLKSDVCAILASGGMELKKWCSNSTALICDIPKDDCEILHDMDDGSYVKTLGILWEPNLDKFKFKVNLPATHQVTKRIVLSEVARIFDPIGLLSPIVVLGKLFMQQLWKLKGNWDEALPMLHHTYWTKFRSELSKLTLFQIPRHLFGGNERPVNIELHGFADASEKAYGAAVYVRSKLQNGQHFVTILCSKSRVAPLQSTTLARLELCAALLLAQLMQRVLQQINFTAERICYWSDSTITLHWIHSEPCSWNTFVANRVAAIQEVCDAKNWFHVESKSNPADVVSRGMMPDKLVNCNLWFSGPTFLHAADSEWLPHSKYDWSSTDEVPERKLAKPLSLVANMGTNIWCNISEMKYVNDYTRMLKTMAYVARYISNSKKPLETRKLLPLDGDDFVAGLKMIIKLIQQECYSDVIKELQTRGALKKGYLKSLSLFIDNEGIIRVGGRLQFSSLSYTSKHPMLFPPNHPFTITFFYHLHRKHLHVGPKTLLAISRETVWTVNGITAAKKTCASCVRCAIVRPKSIMQQMGNLPEERVQISSPFSKVSVDYCGPLYVHYKIRGRAPTKTYVAVYVCQSTKAVHLELAFDLTSACFLGTFKRFVATRGLPVKVFSNNGTNFVGGNSELHELYQMLQSSNLADDIKQMCRDDHIQWHFYPPGSPHFGGLHEAAVKSAKYHLRRVMGRANLTHEELHTLLKQVEAVLNSRPLTAISSSMDDLESITPGHFLIGRPLLAIPEPLMCDMNVNNAKRWELVKTLHQHFWKIWSRDYLTELQRRYKWENKSPNIKVGEIVLLKDDNLPPLKWRLGRVIELHPGANGLTRVVTVQCGPNQTYKRAVTRICPLPIDVERTVQGGEDV